MTERHDTERQDVHALSGAYALDAVTDAERIRFEEHLATCDACRAEVAELREAAALLTESSAVTPPPSVRAGVMAGIKDVRPLPPVVDELADRRESGRSRTATGSRRRWAPLVAAAALAVAGVAIGITQPWADEPVAQVALADRVIEADDARSVRLEFEDIGAVATVVRSEAEKRAVLITEDMPPAPDGARYVVWLQTADGVMEPAAVMPVKESQTVLLEGDASTAVAAGITVEPDPTVAAPTSEPIAVFRF